MEQERQARFFIETSDPGLERRLREALSLSAQCLCLSCAVEAREGRELPAGAVLFLDLRAPAKPVGSGCAVIALGETDDQALWGYRLHAEALLPPVFSWEAFCAALGRCFDCWQVGLKLFTPRRGPSFPLHQLLYAEANGRSTLLCCRGEVLTVSAPFREVLEALPDPPYLQCHRSYAVNVAAVESLSKGQLTLKGGVTVPLSRSRSEGLRQAWQTLDETRRKLCTE